MDVESRGAILVARFFVCLTLVSGVLLPSQAGSALADILPAVLPSFQALPAASLVPCLSGLIRWRS